MVKSTIKAKKFFFHLIGQLHSKILRNCQFYRQNYIRSVAKLFCKSLLQSESLPSRRGQYSFLLIDQHNIAYIDKKP